MSGSKKGLGKDKHERIKRWISVVNNWGNLGQRCFHVCREPQLLGKELRKLEKNKG